MPAPTAFRRAAEVVQAWIPLLESLIATRLPGTRVVLVLDEPGLVVWRDSEGPIEREAAVDLLSGALASVRGIAGVHVCGHGDRRLVLEAGPHLISFEVAEDLVDDGGLIARYLDGGGWVAWGAIPTDGPIGDSGELLLASTRRGVVRAHPTGLRPGAAAHPRRDHTRVRPRRARSVAGRPRAPPREHARRPGARSGVRGATHARGLTPSHDCRRCPDRSVTCDRWWLPTMQHPSPRPGRRRRATSSWRRSSTTTRATSSTTSPRSATPTSTRSSATLRALVEEHPELDDPSLPIHRPGGTASATFAPVRHVVPMLSLDNAFSREELFAWGERLDRIIVGTTFVAEPKMDGLAISLLYRDGRLEVGATRGDGVTGEDVTANVATISGLPKRLRGTSPPAVLEVRGEVYMPTTSFEELNRRQAEAEARLFANPRNAAAGSLRQKDPSITVFQEAANTLRVVAFTALPLL